MHSGGIAIGTCWFEHPRDIQNSQAILSSLEENWEVEEKGKVKQQGK